MNSFHVFIRTDLISKLGSQLVIFALDGFLHLSSQADQFMAPGAGLSLAFRGLSSVLGITMNVYQQRFQLLGKTLVIVRAFQMPNRIQPSLE